MTRLFARSLQPVLIGLWLTVLASTSALAVPPFGPSDAQITILVMDPLAGPLACDCVQGYAQRRYEELAKYLAQETKLTYRVVWSESLELAVHQANGKQFDLIFGKDSMVRGQAKDANVHVSPLASLTDTSGSTWQKGLFVVTKKSNAASLLDLEDTTVLLGRADCDEKHSAALTVLAKIEVRVQQREICESCSVAAKRLLDSSEQQGLAAVISSYASPLLEGCGTIKKGDLKIVGETEPVRFVSAFANSKLPAEQAKAIQNSLLRVKQDSKLLEALESRDGFADYRESAPTISDEADKKKVTH